MGKINDRILGFLKKFQEGYIKRDLSKIENFVEEMFTCDNETFLMGTDITQCGRDKESIQRIIGEQWNDGVERFGDIDFKFSDASIIDKGDVVFVAALGEYKLKLDEGHVLEQAKEDALKVFSGEESPQQKVYTATRLMMKAIKDVDYGTEQTFPIRFTAALKREEDSYKVSHAHFSFDSECLWHYRYGQDSEIEFIYGMDSMKEQSPEVRDVLRKFQEGYTKRDKEFLDEYMNIFTNDDDMITIGTDVDEILHGAQGIRKILEGDWEYWGDFILNVDGAVILEGEECAYFTTQGRICRTEKDGEILNWAPESGKEVLEDEELEGGKRKLYECIYDMMDMMYEHERGNVFLAPMKISGFLIKRDGKWLIHHLHYSDYMRYPEKRI